MSEERYYSDYETEPSGRGNPYRRCIHCKVTEPEINGKLERHREYCQYRKEKEQELQLERKNSRLRKISEIYEVSISTLQEDIKDFLKLRKPNYLNNEYEELDTIKCFFVHVSEHSDTEYFVTAYGEDENKEYVEKMVCDLSCFKNLLQDIYGVFVKKIKREYDSKNITLVC